VSAEITRARPPWLRLLLLLALRDLPLDAGRRRATFPRANACQALSPFATRPLPLLAEMLSNHLFTWT